MNELLSDVSTVTIRWDSFLSWSSFLQNWLKPVFKPDHSKLLKTYHPKPQYIDDPDWMSKVLQSVIREHADHVHEALADELKSHYIHAFHGCRTDNAVSYHHHGIRLNDPNEQAAEVRKIVEQEEGLASMRPTIERNIAEFDSWDRDTGRVYLSADERSLIEDAGHYLISGSEWMQCVLGWGAHAVLRERGVPTVIDVNLPLRTQPDETRRELASKMLEEWTRICANDAGHWVRDIDFSFILRNAVPSSWVISHHHPAYVLDPYYQRAKRITRDPTCPACERSES
jgi:hypothetical protein